MDPAQQPQQPDQGQPQQPEAPDPAKIQQDQMKAQNEALKAQVALHGAAVDVAKAVSDAYYKIDAALTKMTPDSDVYNQLKGVRDAVFIQKTQAESVVQMASGGAGQPPASPSTPGTTATPSTPAPAPTPAAQVPPPAPPPAAGSPAVMPNPVPSAQTASVWDAFRQGKSAKEGCLSTDGRLILHGTEPIFKIVGDKAYTTRQAAASPVFMANVNCLAFLAGVKADGRPKTASATGWIELGDITTVTKSTPHLLLPRR